MDKGPSREPGTDVLAVWETAADPDGKCEMIMKLEFLCPRKYGDVREMIKRSDDAMKSSHRKSYVWLVRAGGRGVIGFKLEELNRLIDEWNNHPCPLMDFWEWLSLEQNDCIRGFDMIWNQGNPLMSYVHIIKGMGNTGI